MPDFQDSLLNFIKPLYQDLDGTSRFEEVERVRRIAERLYQPLIDQDRRVFALLLLFQGLGPWLNKVGNQSRVLLAMGNHVTEAELRTIVDSLRRSPQPQSAAEIALAAARVIDTAGVRGLVSRFAAARREGTNPVEVARTVLADGEPTALWMTPEAQAWVSMRHAKTVQLCRDVLAETDVEDARTSK